MKEREKHEKYQDLDEGLENLGNIKVTVVPVVDGSQGMIPKSIKLFTQVARE